MRKMSAVVLLVFLLVNGGSSRPYTGEQEPSPIRSVFYVLSGSSSIQNLKKKTIKKPIEDQQFDIKL